jgi:hypothetical protein
MKNLKRCIDTAMSGGELLEVAKEEFGPRNFGIPAFKKALKDEGLALRSRTLIIGGSDGYLQQGDWYIWPETPEAAKTWGLPDDINLYLPDGLSIRDVETNRFVLPDGREVARSYGGDAPLYYSEADKYIVDLGGRAAIGELEECWYHSGHGYVDRCQGVVPERYVDRRVFVAIRTRLAMPDWEYELAIGDGIPAGSPLLETRKAKAARRKLVIEEAP